MTTCLPGCSTKNIDWVVGVCDLVSVCLIHKLRTNGGPISKAEVGIIHYGTSLAVSESDGHPRTILSTYKLASVLCSWRVVLS